MKAKQTNAKGIMLKDQKPILTIVVSGDHTVGIPDGSVQITFPGFSLSMWDKKERQERKDYYAESVSMFEDVPVRYAFFQDECAQCNSVVCVCLTSM